MSLTMFKGASGVRIKGGVKSETIHGNHIDETHTTINETSVDREVYYQDDAVGVVNGGGRFSGVLNYTPGASPRPYRRSDGGDPRRQGYDQRDQGSVPSSSRPSARQGHQDRPPSTSAYLRPHTPSTACTPGSAPSLFEGANDVSIEGGVTANTVLGDKHDRGTRTINRKHIPERHYHQEGAVGVINGNGEFSGTLNYGGEAREEPRQGREQGRDRYRSPYPDPDETSSDEGHHFTARARDHYRDQRDAVGVVNDNGKFSGTLNYNSPLNAYPGQRHGWDNSGPRGPPTAPPPPSGQDRDPYRCDQDDTPSIDVESSSPENSDIDDIIGAYDHAYPNSQAGYSGYRQGSPSGLAPPPRGPWDHPHRASYEQGLVHSPSPRISSPTSQYAGGWQSNHPKLPRSPGLPPPYSGQPQGFQDGYGPWGSHSSGSAQGWHGTGTELTVPMANMGLSPRQRVPYPSPPMSRVGQRPFPPEKGRDSYYN